MEIGGRCRNDFALDNTILIAPIPSTPRNQLYIIINNIDHNANNNNMYTTKGVYIKRFLKRFLEKFENKP